MTSRLTRAWVAIVLALIALGLPAGAHAQDDHEQKVIPNIDLKNVDIQDALRTIFGAGGLSFSIHPHVTGSVTIAARNQTVVSVLLMALRQVNATYRVEAGLYTVIPRGSDTGDDEQDPGQKVIRAVEFHGVELREALKQIFREIEVSYSIDPRVKGTITLDMRNQTFTTVLQNVLKQVDATYMIEAGIYLIIPREPGPVPVNGESAVKPKPFSGRFKDLAVRVVLDRLFGVLSAQYTIDPKVQGNVSGDLTNVGFEVGLRRILDQVKASYRVEGGVYRIYPRPAVKPAVKKPGDLIYGDAKYLFIVRGDQLLKVDKKTLKVVLQKKLPPRR